MPVRPLGRALVFPPLDHAEDGLLAVGGDALIKVAERAGIEKVLVARNSSGIALVGIKK